MLVNPGPHVFRVSLGGLKIVFETDTRVKQWLTVQSAYRR